MRKGLKRLIGGILLFVFGGFVVPVAVLLPLLLDQSDERQFIVPGTTDIEITEPARYYLWNDFQTVYEGRSYNRSESIPDGLEIAIKDRDGRTLQFHNAAGISSSSGGNSRRSIGYVEVAEPTRLTISVSGDFDARVFSFSQSGIARMLILILGGFAASVLLSLAGIGIAIWGIVKLAKSKKSGDPKAGGSPLPQAP
jgi:hypothetical protein